MSENVYGSPGIPQSFTDIYSDRYQPYPLGPDAGIRPSTSRTNDRVPAPVGRGTSAVGLLNLGT